MAETAQLTQLQRDDLAGWYRTWYAARRAVEREFSFDLRDRFLCALAVGEPSPRSGANLWTDEQRDRLDRAWDLLFWIGSREHHGDAAERDRHSSWRRREPLENRLTKAEGLERVDPCLRNRQEVARLRGQLAGVDDREQWHREQEALAVTESEHIVAIFESFWAPLSASQDLPDRAVAVAVARGAGVTRAAVVAWGRLALAEQGVLERTGIDDWQEALELAWRCFNLGVPPVTTSQWEAHQRRLEGSRTPGQPLLIGSPGLGRRR